MARRRGGRVVRGFLQEYRPSAPSGPSLGLVRAAPGRRGRPPGSSRGWRRSSGGRSWGGVRRRGTGGVKISLHLCGGLKHRVSDPLRQIRILQRLRWIDFYLVSMYRFISQVTHIAD